MFYLLLFFASFNCLPSELLILCVFVIFVTNFSKIFSILIITNHKKAEDILGLSEKVMTAIHMCLMGFWNFCSNGSFSV